MDSKVIKPHQCFPGNLMLHVLIDLNSKSNQNLAVFRQKQILRSNRHKKLQNHLPIDCMFLSCSRTRFRVNPDPLVAWMSRNSLLKTGVISQVSMTAKLSGCGFESCCNHLNFRYGACFEQWVSWHSGNYRVWIHSKTRTHHDKNILSNAADR